MSFQQEPPALDNQFGEDRVLRSHLKRVLPASVRRDAEADFWEMGEQAGGDLYALQQEDRASEPELTRWDAWGNRVDRISTTALWQRAEEIAARKGLVALAYEQPYGAHSRIVQFALAHLFIPATDVYGCPLAMTDGAARTLLASGNDALIEQAVPHLTSRNPDQFWTSGQWMTELPGGSDVGRSETTARRDDDGTWRLTGRKWFTSAITAQMALALARPEGNAAGSGSGLALFFVRLRDEDGDLRNIRVNRLKDKLGTRKLPTAELALNGTPASPVAGLDGGTRTIAPMLNITRTWNAVTAVSFMRRGLALARDYAAKREAFGAPLAEQPLHVDTLSDLQAEYEGAFQLAFRLVELLGRADADDLAEREQALLRLLTPLAKLSTGKQVVPFMSEILEAFGGAGYVEDTGLPVLLRDAQVLPIWEGTTNVLSLDLLRAVKSMGGLEAVEAELSRCLDPVAAPELAEPARNAQEAAAHAGRWLQDATQQGRDAVEAGARRFALTLGRALMAALLCRHAQWALDEEDARPAAAARRLAARGLDCIRKDAHPDEAVALANDEPLRKARGDS